MICHCLPACMHSIGSTGDYQSNLKYPPGHEAGSILFMLFFGLLCLDMPGVGSIRDWPASRMWK